MKGMKNWKANIGKKITIAKGVERWNGISYVWEPVTGILQGFMRYTDDNGAVGLYATVDGYQYNVTYKTFKLAE